MSQRLVQCRKLGREAPGLDAPPFADELGKEIYENVSAEAWQAWQGDMMIKVINEYRLNLAEQKDFDTLIEQMRLFLQLDGGGAGLEVENPERGKSA